jgi:uncharacterized protein
VLSKVIRHKNANILVLLAVALLTSASMAYAEPGTRFERGLLWRIDVHGTPPSYVFGTLHTDDDRVLSIPAPARAAFGRSRIVALEVIDDEVSVQRFRAAMVSNDPKLPTLLGVDQFREVDALLREHGIPAESAYRLKPWAALLLLTQPLGTTAFTLDNFLALQARDQKKQIVALETVDEQIAAFEGIPEDTQLALLRHIQSQHAEIQAAIFPMINAYLARDLAALYRINAEAMEGDANIARHNEIFLECVLYDRSERFARHLGPVFREGGVFAAFGAMHLYGARGVLGLLERQGFRVRRIY